MNKTFIAQKNQVMHLIIAQKNMKHGVNLISSSLSLSSSSPRIPLTSLEALGDRHSRPWSREGNGRREKAQALFRTTMHAAGEVVVLCGVWAALREPARRLYTRQKGG